MEFYWVRKEDDYRSPLDKVGLTAYAVIKDFIEKNNHKSLEDLRNDLDIRIRNHGSGWDNNGLHPFTLRQHVNVKDEHRFFLDKKEIIHLHNEKICISKEWGANGDSRAKWKRLVAKMNNLGYTLLAKNEEVPIVLQEVSLLLELFQIILYGPPGTGKTYRARKVILPQLLGITESDMDGLQGERWDIVQFHPSYNYEDFVRGVKVETIEKNVVYKTGNRTFGDICKRAEDDLNPNNKYALIIDEINRANVSAVLGELIYALEYRGNKIKTPYTIDGAEDSMLVIPKNLYIIGTMNTADRTIGQIDYAVRRRFAFVQCLPKESVITDKKAREAFSLVEEIFDKEEGYMSPDYDADDVRVGHSYFLAEGGKLARKIIYQVIPILREYVKDGILSKEAELKISEIEQKFIDDAKKKDELKEKSDTESTKEDIKGHSFFYWEKDGKFHINGIGRTVLSITHDHLKKNPTYTVQGLQKWFPDRNATSSSRGIKYESEINKDNKKNFFTNAEDVLHLEGQTAYVTREWSTGYRTETQGSFEDFRKAIGEKDYKIRNCYVVNIQEVDKKRSWDACMEFGFVSASGVKDNGQLRTIGLQKIKKGDIVFALLLTDSDKNKGFIGMGEVLEEAVPINKFKMEGKPILNYLCKDGQKYRKKYPAAAEHAGDEQKREWMIRVKWLRVLPRKEAKGSSTPGHVTFSKVSPSNLKIIKAKFEKVE